IAEPWATDSAGKPLKTWFSWSEGLLTQHVDLEDPRITYPVLLDPYWGYVFTYDLTVSPSVAWAKLKSCFSCRFPVAGAPAAFPAYNQLMPLKMSIQLPWGGLGLSQLRGTTQHD